MNAARGPIQRPILTTMIYMVIITVGLIAFSRLSVDLMPEITYPTISVVTSYGNVGPEEMEELITRPIEEALAAVQGVEEITSSSSEGQSSVRVAFTWGADLDASANDIRDRIDRVLPRLPEGIDRPMIRKFDLSAFPILILSVGGDLDPLELRQIIDDQVKYRLERVPGVAAVDVRGGLNREIHVNLKAAQLKALGLSPSSVAAALRRENRNIPAGLFEEGNLEILMRTQGEFLSLDQIRATAIAVRDGTPIRIGDIAEVEDSHEEVRQLVRLDGKPAVRISVNKQSGANTVTVARAVLEELERIHRDLPHIRVLPIIDTSQYIEQSINNVGRSTLFGGLLAVLVLFLFLRNLSSTAIIATAIPISIVATFGLMYFGGFTLNIMTFGALALGIGMLVDSSIVVLENIYRHRESGQGAVASALAGSGEVAAAIVASTLTTLVVFFPVLFIRGMTGIMFQQMAYVVSFALLCSLVVALTLIPMLAALLMRRVPGQGASEPGRLQRLYAASETAFQRIEEQYGQLLGWALRHRRLVWLSALGLFAVSVVLVRWIGVELMPQADESEVRVTLEMEVGARLEVVDDAVRTVEETIRREVPERTAVFSRIGGGGWRSRGGHTAEIRVTLVPRSERRRSSEEVANALRPALAGLPGVTLRTRAGQGLFLLRMGQSSGDNISVEVRGHDLAIAQQLAAQVEAVVKEVAGITDARVSRQEGSPERIVRIDREKATDLGLSVEAIGEALQTTIGGTYASYYRAGGKEYRILLRLSEQDRRDLNELLDLTVINSSGRSIALRNVVDAVPQLGPVSLERKDQERVITVSANFTGRDLGSIVRDIRQGLLAIPVPPDFSIQLGQEYEDQKEAFRELLFGLVLALVLIYMVMAGQFESFRDPLVVLFSIPMGLIGVVATMILSNTIFSMQAFIGCIMLTGIVVNNAILLVDYTNRLRRQEQMPLQDAIRLSGSRRLRPILMTTLTTALGLLPLSFGLGEGGEAQAPLARVVIGGLLSSTLITLVLIPVIYSLFEQGRGPGGRGLWSRLRRRPAVVTILATAGLLGLGGATAQDVTVQDVTAPDVMVRDVTVQDVTAQDATVQDVRAQDAMVRDATAQDAETCDVGGRQAWAQHAGSDTLRISLPEAVLTALENNPSFAIQRLAPAIAETYAAGERAAFDPVLTATGTRREAKTQRFLGSNREPFEETSGRSEYAAGIEAALPTGTTVALDASVNGSTSSIYDAQYSGAIGLTVTQSLLRGLGTGPNLASLRQARLDLEISRAELKGMAQSLLARTERAYWLLYLAAREVQIQEESVRLALRQMEESRERIAVGRLPELELAAVRAEVARRRGGLIDAQSGYEQARLEFLYLLNPRDERGWGMIPLPTDNPVAAVDSLDDPAAHEALALARRPDLEQARLAHARGELEVTRTRNGLLPRLDFFITLGRTSYAQSFAEAAPDIGSPFYGVSGGLSFEFPIPNREARARAQRAEISRRQLDLALENMERMVERDVRSACVEVGRTQQQITATRVTRELQQAHLDAELEKFRVGRSTNLLVLQVQRDLTASKLDEIRALVDYLNARVDLHLMEGTILERRRIALPEGS